MVLLLGKLLAVVAVSGVAFLFIQRPRLPIIPPRFPTSKVDRHSARGRRRHRERENSSGDVHAAFQNLDSQTNLSDTENEREHSVLSGLTTRRLEAYASSEFWDRVLDKMNRAFVPACGGGSKPSVSQQELIGFLETAEHMLVEPAVVSTEPARGTSGSDSQQAAVYKDPNPIVFSILDMMHMDLLPGLNLVLDMIDMLMQRAYLLLDLAPPSPQASSRIAREELPDNRRITKEVPSSMGPPAASVQLTVCESLPQVDVSLVVKEGAAPAPSQGPMVVQEELGHDDWVIQDDLSVNILPDDWLGVSVTASPRLNEQAAFKAPAAADDASTVNAVELRLRPYPVQERVFVNIKLVWEASAAQDTRMPPLSQPEPEPEIETLPSKQPPTPETVVYRAQQLAHALLALEQSLEQSRRTSHSTCTSLGTVPAVMTAAVVCA